jgi:hypothetical protein
MVLSSLSSLFFVAAMGYISDLEAFTLHMLEDLRVHP